MDSVEEGRAVLSVEVRKELKQLQGVMHGGAIASLIDTAVAFAIVGALAGRPLHDGRDEGQLSFGDPAKAGSRRGATDPRRSPHHRRDVTFRRQRPPRRQGVADLHSLNERQNKENDAEKG